MKGQNEIHLNHSTMVEAVQMYFDSQFKVAPKVVSVEQESNLHGGPVTFCVDVTDEEKIIGAGR